jgi:hypothetical protein
MKKNFRIGVLAVFVFIVAGGYCAFAQQVETRAAPQVDARGCSVYGTNIHNPSSLEFSLWTFRSNVWDGYIDFQDDGKYFTHWGMGTWTVNADGETLHLSNDYNEKTYEVAFTDSGFRYQGLRNDGLVITGKLICAKYQGPGPEVPEDVEKAVMYYYKTLYERDPDTKELHAKYRDYLQGKTIEQIKEDMVNTTEYEEKAAIRAAKYKELEDNGQLQW